LATVRNLLTRNTDDLAVPFGDPAAFPCGVEGLDEFGDDLRHQRLEPLVPAIVLRIERAVTVDDPAHVARPVRSEPTGRGVGPPAEDVFDRPHGADQAGLPIAAQTVQQRADLPARPFVERREGGAPLGRQ
jgi:hypothetical protein